MRSLITEPENAWGDAYSAGHRAAWLEVVARLREMAEVRFGVSREAAAAGNGGLERVAREEASAWRDAADTLEAEIRKAGE